MAIVFITGSTRGFGSHLATAFSVEKHTKVITNGRYSGDFIKDAQYIFKSDLEKIHPDIIINNAFDDIWCLYSGISQVVFLEQSINYFLDKGGTIINVNSMAGLNIDVKDPLYSAAKHGLRGYSESVKFDAIKKGIKIIDLYPGAIATGMAEGREDFDKLIDPKELAEFVVTLCGTKSFVVSSIQFNRV